MLRLQIQNLRRLPIPPLRIVCRSNCIPRSIQLARRSSTNAVTSPAPNNGVRMMFPKRLAVYHSGSGRTLFLGCLKISTIFMFSFFCFFVAPTHFLAENNNQPEWVAPVVFLSGIVPMVAVAYITNPYVTKIHLNLPAFARYSRQRLLRYTRTLPKDTEIEIISMNFIGKPRVTRLKIGELHPVKKRFGIANYERDTKEINRDRPWYLGKATRLFGIHDTKKVRGGQEIWQNFKKSIDKK